MTHDLIFDVTDERLRGREQLTYLAAVYNERTQNIPLTAVREQ